MTLPVMTRTMTRTSKPLTQVQVGLKYGFRSGLEGKIAAELEAAGVAFFYEKFAVPYVKPQKPSKYTPDFILPNGIIVETKGRFLTADRQKHRLVKEQHPDLDIRFVFNNPRARISKTSDTSYAAWCARYGFKFAKETIPAEWLREPLQQKRETALKRIGATLPKERKST